MNKESENHSELMDFLQVNREKTRGGKMIQYAFNAHVVYRASEITIFTTMVRVDTDAQTPGKISLTENQQCPSSKFHLDFQAKYQAMCFDRNSNILVISGKSTKMGSYEVLISAIGPLS